MTTNLTKMPAEVWLKIVIAIVFCGFMVNDLWQIFQHQKTWEGAIHEHWFLPFIIVSNLRWPWAPVLQLSIASVVLWLDLRGQPLTLATFHHLSFTDWMLIVFSAFTLAVIIYMFAKKVLSRPQQGALIR